MAVYGQAEGPFGNRACRIRIAWSEAGPRDSEIDAATTFSSDSRGCDGVLADSGFVLTALLHRSRRTRREGTKRLSYGTAFEGFFRVRDLAGQFLPVFLLGHE